MKNIAIIGFSGIFPDARTIQQFAENLSKGKCSINNISTERLQDTCVSNEPEYSKGGYIDHITGFDYDFFEIPLGEAEEMSPNQKLALQEAYKTFEHASYRFDDLKGSNTSVYVADTNIDYYQLAYTASPTLIAGNTNALIGSRISRFFDLRGGAVNVDTTCSSSLTAIILACKDLQLEDTDLALVNSVNINVIPPHKNSEVVLGVESKSETCSPFSERADGAIHGEAVACLLLKREEDAIKDGNIIYGLIKGYALNQDAGQSSSIMAPSSEAQASVIEAALQKAGLTPEDVDFIEAHGTGTKLGDPIEIEGMSQVFTKDSPSDKKLYIGSVKSNIGHTDSAAGMAGVIKTLISFKNRTLYPSINSRPLNPLIDFEKSNIEVIESCTDYNFLFSKKKIIAGVSSFGLSGTNAHIILEFPEERPMDISVNNTAEQIFCFSARSKKSLLDYIKTFLTHLETTQDSIEDIAYSLNTGKNIFEYRIPLKAKDISELRYQLETLSDIDSNEIALEIDYPKKRVLLFDESYEIHNDFLLNIPHHPSFKNLNKYQKSALLQYYSYLLLKDSGIMINDMIGIGIGKEVIQLIKKNITIDELLIKLGSEYSEESDNESNLLKRTEKLLNTYNEAIKIISIGYSGRLGNIFAEKFRQTENIFQYIGYGVSLEKNLETLFGFKEPVDPKPFYFQKRNLVELPTYVFDEKRCWIRKKDDSPFLYGENTIKKEILDEIKENISMEEQLSILWKDILKTEIDTDSDFFDLGGHSLNGTQLINRINQLYNVQLTIDDLFENGTPEMMASHLTSLSSNISSNKIPVSDAKEYYVTSYGQKRLWLLDKISKESSNLNIAINLIIEDTIDLSALQRSFHILIERHESLRTSFTLKDNEIMQKINSIKSVENYFEVLYGISEKDIDAKLSELSNMKFDLESKSLIKVTLLPINGSKNYLNICLHHIICDGWSIEILQNELFHIYNRIKKNENIDLKKLHIQYKDYAEFQINNIHRRNESEKFWTDTFSDLPQSLTLQMQNIRQPYKRFKGKIKNFVIPDELTQKIKRHINKDTTLTMMLSAFLNILVSKLSNSNDIVIGLPITTRNNTELENQIGFFLNTLPIRTKVNPDETFPDLLQKVSRQLKNAYKHQEYPLELIIDTLKIRRDPGRMPLFDIVLTVQNYLNVDLSGPDKPDTEMPSAIKVSHYTNNDLYNSSQYDLVYRFVENEDSIFYELEYDTDLFDDWIIDSYHRFLLTLMEQCFSDNDMLPLEEMALLSQEEISNLLPQETKEEMAESEDILHYIFKNINSQRSKTAIIYDDHEYSYGYLDEMSSRFANFLSEKYGLKYQDKVIVSCDATHHLITIILGIMKSRMIYVPLDKKLPLERLEYIRQDVNAQLMIDDHIIDDFLLNSAIYSPEFSVIKNKKTDLLYIIYTSGSTGKPKGVMINHENLMHLMINCHKHHFDFCSNDVWTLYHNYSFDFSVWEIFAPLFHGGKLLVLQREKVIDFDYYTKQIVKHNVSILNFTPKVFEKFDTYRKTKNIVLNKLRYVIFGGDILTPGILQNWKQDHQDCKLINMYGITEITVHGTFKELSHSEIFASEDVSNIGKEISGLNFYILDEKLKPCPSGFIGEIYIKGRQVSSGYYNKPELTQDRFISLPQYQLEKVYKSGDLGRKLHSGDIEYIGRIDDQVKINGHRIELKEIENTILELEEVEMTHVTSIHDSDTSHLIAYVKLLDKNYPADNVKKALKHKIPYYMVPHFIVQVDDIKLNSNGKVDKSGLPPINQIKETINVATSLLSATDIYIVKPDQNISDIISNLFCDILNFNNIPKDTSFFDLGGTSLQLITLHSEIDKLWPESITIADLFEASSADKIAAHIENGLSRKEEIMNNNLNTFEI